MTGPSLCLTGNLVPVIPLMLSTVGGVIAGVLSFRYLPPKVATAVMIVAVFIALVIVTALVQNKGYTC